MPQHDCGPRRAAPMPPDARRAAILTAAVPLLRERGAQVSTRELAEAAGVAEGTLFRVFPDKRALLRAALAEAMDPEPLVRDLAGVDRGDSLEDRMTRVVEIVSRRMDGVMQLVTALHDLADSDSDSDHRPRDGGAHRGDAADRDTRLLAAIADVLEPDRARLRVTPLQAASMIRAVVFGDRMPGLPDGARLAPAAVASCLVRGLAAAPAPAREA